MKSLKPGDRVAVYNNGIRSIEIVACVYDDGLVDLCNRRVTVSRKQCYLITPKKRREFWAGREFPLERFRLFEGEEKPGAIHADGIMKSVSNWEWIRVREVREK